MLSTSPSAPLSPRSSLPQGGALLLSTLQTHYPNATGLKYQNPATKAYRVVSLRGNTLVMPPNPELHTFMVTRATGMLGNHF